MPTIQVPDLQNLDQFKTNIAPKTPPWAVASSYALSIGQAGSGVSSLLGLIHSHYPITPPVCRPLMPVPDTATDRASGLCTGSSSLQDSTPPLLCLSLNRTQKRRIILDSPVPSPKLSTADISALSMLFVSLNEPPEHVNSLVSLLTLSLPRELCEGRAHFSHAHCWFQLGGPAGRTDVFQ